MPSPPGSSIVQFVLNAQDAELREKFFELGGRSALRLGLPRSLGQIYSALYLSPRPLSLQDLMDTLDISKGNASMSVRQLAAWGAVEQVWVKGDRRDFYQANADFGRIVRRWLGAFLKPRLESTAHQLEEMAGLLPAPSSKSDPDEAFIRERLAKLQKFQNRIRKAIPIAEKLL